MKALVQRCCGHTEIKIGEGESGKRLAFDGPGMVVLLGWTRDDEDENLIKEEDWIVSRVVGLRIFPDAEAKMNASLETYTQRVAQNRGGILWVPQFTLAGKLESGFRPSFSKAMDPGLARFRFSMLVNRIQEMVPQVTHIFGSFGADMELSFTNWGPVTLMIDSKE